MLYSEKGFIQQKLTWMILMIVSIVAFLGYALFVTFYFNNQKKESMALARTIAHVTSQDLAKLVLMNNVSIASDITTKLDAFDHIHALVLYKKDGTPVYQYSHDHKNFEVKPLIKDRHYLIRGHHMELFIKAKYHGVHLGYIYLDLKVKTFAEIAKENVVWFTIMYLFMMMISYLLAIYYARKFTNPIRNLVDFLQEVKWTGSLKKRMMLHEENEFGVLYQKVNLMLDKIEMATKQQRIAAVAFETPSGMVITDADKNVLQVNRAYTEISGYTLEDVVGRKPPVLQSNIEDESFYKMIDKALKENHFWSGELRNYRKNGEIFSEYLTIQEVCNEEGVVTHYVFSFMDITQQKEAEEKVAFLMQYDPLTGLANKELLLESLREGVSQKERKNRWHFLLAFDIKNFKLINDAYGYETGDMILKEVSRRLVQEFSEADRIAKIGIDEFILSYRNLKTRSQDPAYLAKMTAEYMLSVMSEPFVIHGKTISISIHIGIDLYDDNCHSVNNILKHTNIALQLAKEKDEKIAFFDKKIENQARYHIDTYTQLKNALQLHELELYYQPQYDTSERMIGVEALIRWNHPEQGVLAPDMFIPVAEKTGLIIQIGEWTLEYVCQKLQEWQKEPETSNLSISVNISAKQFNQKNFIGSVLKVIQKYYIPEGKLKFELTESVLIDDIDDTIMKMERLKLEGITISMDDFGTGYSSLEYLRRLPLTQIKIDRSFIMEMRQNEKDMALVKTMLSLGEAFGFEVVAEGVEEREDIELLKKLGCHYFQGFYFSRPLPERQLEEKIKLSVDD
jgi:diguanylate cyclase (GGDEF)-like protein/PAS domain S-box-containing protein